MSIAVCVRSRVRSTGFGVAVAAAMMMPTGASAQKAGADQVTFTKDVAPILQRSCVTCHRPGESAPMSLITYEDARPWARAIKTRVAAREMPPWHIDRNLGIQKFKGDPSLAEEEIATIVKWADGGAPRGNPADMPPLRQFADGSSWQIGKPDLIVRFPVNRVPATGPDLFPQQDVPLNLPEDRYIKAIQTRPVNMASRRVVHHSITLAVDANDVSGNSGDDTVDGGVFLVEYASGKNGEVYPADSGLLLQAGKRMRMNYHLHSVGEEVMAEVEVGVVLYPKGYIPKHIRYSTHQGDPTTDLDIPAGEIARVDGYTLLNRPARIIAFQPHMHTRGKYQCIELIYPSNPSKNMKSEMINCAHFNYNWHLTYNYADEAAPLVPAGTVVHIISWHDNTPANKNAADPKNWVGYGQRTIDDMGFAWVGWVDLTDDEYKQEVAARKELQKKQTSTATGQQQ